MKKIKMPLIMRGVTRVTTLAEVRVWVKHNRREGVKCPCCQQHAKIYKRPINGAMSCVLILLQQASTQLNEWIHIPELLSTVGPALARLRGGDYAKLGYWGLIERKRMLREDGSPRAGYFRITSAGREFVQNKLKVPRFALIYDEKCLGVTGPKVSIKDTLGAKFDYTELMNG